MEAFNGGLNAFFCNASVYLMMWFEDPLMVMSLCLSVCNNSCIKCFFIGLCSSIGFFGQQEFIGSSFGPNSMIVITCIDDLRNANGHLMPDIAIEIPFLSHLMQCDGITCVMATCRVLIGWRWHASQ